MSKIYDKYFSEEDFFNGLSKLMYDISFPKISKRELVELSDELVEKEQIPVSSQFERKKWWGWSKKYVDYLMNGMSTGRVSKEYLLFYAKVSGAVKLRNTIFKIAAVFACLLIVFWVINSLIRR